jgi:tellurite resistance protein TehA-like permease
VGLAAPSACSIVPERGVLGAFAVVMATAIASVAIESDAVEASSLLAGLAVGAFALLALRALVRMRVGRDRIMDELHRPRTMFDSFTIVASTGVLSARFSLDGYKSLADVFAGLTAATWLILGVLVSATLVATRGRVRDDLSGNWLLAVVATQSLAAVAATTAHSADKPPLSVVAFAAWILGLTLYTILLWPLIRRLRLAAAQRRFTPDYWIAMGALAISTLAAAAVLQAPGAPLRAILRIGGLATWLGACLWIPVLIVADAKTIISRTPGLPDMARWSMVFPLGMFSAATQAYNRADAAPALTLIGRWTAWIAVAAWAVVAIGTGRHAIAVATRHSHPDNTEEDDHADWG